MLSEVNSLTVDPADAAAAASEDASLVAGAVDSVGAAVVAPAAAVESVAAGVLVVPPLPLPPPQAARMKADATSCASRVTREGARNSMVFNEKAREPVRVWVSGRFRACASRAWPPWWLRTGRTTQKESRIAQQGVVEALPLSSAPGLLRPLRTRKPCAAFVTKSGRDVRGDDSQTSTADRRASEKLPLQPSRFPFCHPGTSVRDRGPRHYLCHRASAAGRWLNRPF